jgi:hypothetical protein
MHFRFRWTLTLLLGIAPTLMGQQVRGRVITAADSTPVPHALLLLLDEGGKELARSSTSPSGGFDLQAPTAGRFRVRVQRIGQHGWEAPPVDVTVGTTLTLTLQVPETPFELPPLEVVNRRPRCGVRLRDGTLGAAVLEAAQTALGLAEAEASMGRRTYAAESYRRTVPDLGPALDSTVTNIQLTGWPIESADPDSLRIHGFVHGHWPPPNSVNVGPLAGPTYFAPDARVMFSDWFLETHCIALDTASADHRRLQKALVARFEPARGTRAVAALKGQLVFDRSTLGLRLLTFEFVARPPWAPRGSAGGELRFARLPDGVWVPVSWQLRVPLPKVGADRYRFYGLLEVGGRVRSIRLNGRPDPQAEKALTGAL